MVIAVAIAIAAALWLGGGAPRSAPESSRMEPPSVARERASGHASRDDEPRARATSHKREPGARETLRRDIVRALERRGIDADAPSTAAPRSATPDDDEGAPSGALKDRIGGRDALLQRLNADFMPLADECMQQARERAPDLRGLVAIDVKLLAERDVGAIVEDAAPAAENEIEDPELIECLQQTLYSTTLPGEAVDGLEGVMISLRADET